MGTTLVALLVAAGLGLLPDVPTRSVGPELDPGVARPGKTIERLDGLVRLPPLVSPGETIEFTPLNPAKTLPGGRWQVAGVEAQPIEGSEPRLRVQLPANLDSMGPLPVVYIDPKGKRLVEASGLEQSRIVPAAVSGGLPSGPRLSRCGSRWVQD